MITAEHNYYAIFVLLTVLAVLSLLYTKHKTFTGAVGALFYWLGFGVLLIAALLGVAAFGSLMALAFILIVVFGLFLAIGFIPLVVWVAIFDQAQAASLISEIKKAINAPNKGN